MHHQTSIQGHRDTHPHCVTQKTSSPCLVMDLDQRSVMFEETSRQIPANDVDTICCNTGYIQIVSSSCRPLV